MTPSSPVGGNNANKLNKMRNEIEAENVDEEGTSSHRGQRLVLGSSGGQEPEQKQCGTTHYAGCACHEKGWENKWKCAVEMAAHAEANRDEWMYRAKAAERTVDNLNETIDGIKDQDIAVYAAARAMVERWDTPLWKDAPATAGFINRLRDALSSENAERTCADD